MNSEDDKTRLENMDLRSILIETRLTQIHQNKKLDEICKTLKEQERRIQELEKHDVAYDAVKAEGKDTTALIIALAAIIISATSTILGLIGG